MLEFPWKRNTLIAYLNEMVDAKYQNYIWGTNHDGVYEGVHNCFDFFIEDENLNKSSNDKVGYYIFLDEADLIENFSMLLLKIISSMENKYDSKEAINMSEWPKLMNAAAKALDKVLDNNKKYKLPQ